ncbi:MAG: hypothetical protein J0L67_02855 [Cytophagales bacterium]|nr:hypothetical protein [Cytophagales bacterium]
MESVKNKILKMAVALTVALMMVVFIIRMFFSSANSLSYKIFKADAEGYYFHKLLRIIPSSYQDRYSKTILDSFDNMQLINLEDDMGSSHKNFIVLINGTDSKFLKAYPFELVGVKMETVERYGWNKHVSLLINIDVLNEYLRSKQLKSKEESIKMYCSFLSNPIDQSTYKILHNASDIDSLIAHWPLSNLEFIKDTDYNLIDARSIDFDQPSGTVFCWFYETGVVKFVFSFNDDNTIKSVDSDIVGLLGNEAPSI